MGLIKSNFRMLSVTGLILALLVSFVTSASGQTYPSKPITIIDGYDAGGNADVTARGLADGASKFLGVPVVVENKPGGAATVAATLVAKAKPDGYTLGIVANGALVVRPHMIKLPYTLEDFTALCQYSKLCMSLCVLNESPIKTIDEFIAYAKTHPGLSYSTSGMYSTANIVIEILAKCKGLNFTHLPTKGGTAANTALLGKHVDFTGGGSSQMPLVKQGVFRQLLMGATEEHNPTYPDVPIMKDLGCEDIPTEGMMVFGPKGIPDAIAEKLMVAFEKASDEPKLHEILNNLNITRAYVGGKKFEKQLQNSNVWYDKFFRSVGIKK